MHDRQDGGPVRRAGLAAALVGGLGPFDLERPVRRANDAGHLDRDRPLADIGERIGRRAHSRRGTCAPRSVAKS